MLKIWTNLKVYLVYDITVGKISNSKWLYKCSMFHYITIPHSEWIREIKIKKTKLCAFTLCYHLAGKSLKVYK